MNIPKLGFIVCCSLWVFAACDDLSEFKTHKGEAFVGEVVGSDSDPIEGSFIRTGFASHTQMILHFDPDLANLAEAQDAGTGENAGPGTLSTYVCPKGKTSCAKGERENRDFDLTRLESITGLAHDALSEYTFPGGGRLRNYMFGARFVSADVLGTMQRNAMVFVSLMENGKVEVRVIASSVLGPSGNERWPALFGVFVLGRHST